MARSLDPIIEHIPTEVPGGRRFVLAIAGPPAAGKSTLAERLRSDLAPRAAVLGMDAFHFDDRILEARGHRDRKGAPHTFDVVAYRHTVQMLRSAPDVEVSIPVFDRSLELTRNCAEVVSADHDIIITEGNYLLLDQDPWTELSDLFDLTVWVEAPRAAVEERIMQRWRGYGHDDLDAAELAETNDLPNADLVVNGSRRAMVEFPGIEWPD